MDRFDTVITNGTVITAVERMRCDVAIKDGKVAALGHDLGDAATEINAAGKLVLPGGVEGHCHIEQKSAVGGVMNADDFYSATVSAAFGGTTTILPFAAQYHGQSLRQVVED